MELRQIKYFAKLAETLNLRSVKSPLHNSKHFITTDKAAGTRARHTVAPTQQPYRSTHRSRRGTVAMRNGSPTKRQTLHGKDE